MIVGDKADRHGTPIVGNRTVSQEMGGLFVVRATIASLITMPDVIFHLVFYLECSIEENSMPQFVHSF